MKDDFWVAESNDLQSLPLKRKRNAKSKRLEYSGWASVPLIEFLHSVGKDTSTKFSQLDVASIITDYVNAHNLVNPEKKKKILCDEKLHSLFGKKVVSRIKIYDLLEPHFTENQDSSEDDFGSGEDDNQYVRPKKTSNSDSKPYVRKLKVPEIPKSCFAAVIPENIRLVYLKRTLVQDLIKVPESFEEKILGSFVRIKSDPHDFRQKLPHQLQQVIGVRMIAEADKSSSVVELQLSDFFKQVSLNMLSDDNFSEEECDNLQERVKGGLLKRPTVVELEAKARMLHKDIMKHWIPREISRLQKLIDRANEKGWRRELFEYLEKKQLLQKPSEQERLLSEIPKVIADKLEPELMPEDLEKVEDGDTSPKSERGISNMNGSAELSYGKEIIDLQNIITYSEEINAAKSTESIELEHGKESRDSPPTVTCFINTIGSGIVNNDSANHHWKENVDEVSRPKNEEADCENDNSPIQKPTSMIGNESRSSIKTEDYLDSENGKKICQGQEVKATEVIELSDDEEDEVMNLKNEKQQQQQKSGIGNPEERVWYYRDPQGQVQGPFPMSILKRWKDANYFHPAFRVWKISERPDSTFLLTDVIRYMFHHL